VKRSTTREAAAELGERPHRHYGVGVDVRGAAAGEGSVAADIYLSASLAL
jgi:hypothetical protein